MEHCFPLITKLKNKFKKQERNDDMPMFRINPEIEHKRAYVKTKLDLLFKYNHFRDDVDDKHISYVIDKCFLSFTCPSDNQQEITKVMCNVCCHNSYILEYHCHFCDRSFTNKCPSYLHIIRSKYNALYKKRYCDEFVKHMKCIIVYELYVNMLYDYFMKEEV